MSFNSLEDIKKDILNKMQHSAIQKAQEEIYQVINRFIKEYYSEYSPLVYERTYQLFQSLVKSEVINTSNGCKARVYFDIDSLDYAVKHMTKIKKGNEYMNPYNKKTSASGEFPNPWSGELVMEYAAKGYHGKTKGTAIWDESLSILDAEGCNILKRMLIDSGIPIK